MTGVFYPKLSGGFLDTVISGVEVSTIIQYAVVFFSLLLIQLFVSYSSAILNSRVINSASMKMTENVLWHMQHLPISFFDESDPTYFSHRVNSDCMIVIQFSLTLISTVISNSISTYYAIYNIWTTNFLVLAVIMICICIYVVQYIVIGDKLYNANLEMKEAQSTTASRLVEQLSNIKMVKTFYLYDFFLKRLEGAFNSLLSKTIYAEKVGYIPNGSKSFVSSASRYLIMVVAGILLMRKKISVGDYTILLSYYTILIGYVNGYMMLAQIHINTKVSYERIKQITDESEEQFGNEQMVRVEEICIQNLSFNYKSNIQVIRNLNCIMRKGNIYCIYGPNGCGKSTLASILSGMQNYRFSGKIIFSNSNRSCEIQDLSEKCLKTKLISVSPQDALIIHDTVYNNLTLNASVINRQRLDELVNDFELFNKHNHLEYDCVLEGDGANLSGGELRKISIIRCLLRPAEVMLFDEPTTHLDSKSCEIFASYLEKLKRKAIVIVITHDIKLKDICDYTMELQ